MARLEPADASVRVAATRVVIDSRPLQVLGRDRRALRLLQRLLGAYADDSLAGESFVILERVGRSDPTAELERRGLPVVARRRLPPTSRLFRSAGLTLDSFLLRGAEIGTAAGPGSAAAGTIFHTAGGAVPLASGLPIVATLLDLAPWELPRTYAASPAARFGHRLRARVLYDAARVIVCARAVAESARRRLHLDGAQLRIVPLAVDADFRAAGRDAGRQARVRGELELPDRYFLFCGRYDARKDMPTLFRALRGLRKAGRRDLPPLIVLPRYEIADERQAVERAMRRSGLGELVRVAPPVGALDRAALTAGATAFIFPSLAEATGIGVLEALSVGVPVICSRAGALPEMVGSAGIIVEPREPTRLAAAIEAVMSGGALSEQLRRQARARADADQRSWGDVARETRMVYAEAAMDAQRRPRRRARRGS